jgi:hypothetical protein
MTFLQAGCCQLNRGIVVCQELLLRSLVLEQRREENPAKFRDSFYVMSKDKENMFTTSLCN